MSYCRNNGTDSDVYVIGSFGTLECCGCYLYKNSARFNTYSALLKHLDEHKRRGDKVPDYAIKNLKKDQAQGNIYAGADKKLKLKNVRVSKEKILEHKLYTALKPTRKFLLKKVLTTFNSIYGRMPTKLEVKGLAYTVNIELDLMLDIVCGDYK